MEVKIPREVRKYQESVVTGLSMRQFICSSLAVGIAVLAYFGLRQYMGNEGVSWICILLALPIALIGFVTYHDMTFENFIVAWIRSEFLMPKQLMFFSDNYMHMSYQDHSLKKKSHKQIQMKGSKQCQIH